LKGLELDDGATEGIREDGVRSGFKVGSRHISDFPGLIDIPPLKTITALETAGHEFGAGCTVEQKRLPAFQEF
jgi:hypothetical protein